MLPPATARRPRPAVPRPFDSCARATVAFALGLALTGCGRAGTIFAPHSNQRPTVEFTRAPIDPAGRFDYMVSLSWIGNDPDGRIEEYCYAVDPPGPSGDVPFPETTWVHTKRNEVLVRFGATRPDSVRGPSPAAYDFHTLVLKALDNGGMGGVLQSEPRIRTFFATTIAPTVQILSPTPSDRGRTYVPPTVLVSWFGRDEDGAASQFKPVQYKYILLTQNTAVSFATALGRPDSVRSYYAPRNWAGWDSTTSEVTSKRFTDLVPGQDYMFCLVAIDEAGAYSPVFSMASNMLNMRAVTAGQSGPRMTVWGDGFFYSYNPGVYSTLPQYQIRTEVPQDQPITIHWVGEAVSGSYLTGFRWALDIEDLSDPTERSNERTDLAHWSASAIGLNSATVGPFPPGEFHYFYVEAIDNNGFRSLAIVVISVARTTFEKPLLIVNDTRLPVDQRQPGTACMDRPKGRWPTSAELDTFLYARGGVPWRCYPVGTLSETGLFYGYPFDTMGTRTGQGEVRVPLAVLGQYRHVIWLTDSKGGTNDHYGTTVASSIGALRYMCSPGHSNSLAAYVQQGGDLWLLGGGAAYASLIPYNRTANDITSPAPGITFSAEAGEIVPGRFLYDRFGWRSEIKLTYAPNQILRCFGRYDSTGAIPAGYARLPARMRTKSAALGDVFPPWRTYNPGDFYQNGVDLEYLSRPNAVVEDIDPSLTGVDEQSTLDTLYRAVGPALVPANFNPMNVCMTRSIGPDAPHVIFGGFNVWNFTRADASALVNAVLQDLWGFAPPPRAAVVAARLR